VVYVGPMAIPDPKAPVEYVAALCHMRNGGLVDYDSIRFTASSEAEAKRLANEWCAKTIGAISEETWLQVKRYSDSYCIQSTPFGVR
jgi:uncharacterized protein YqjF (DUF2071 family)